MKVDPIEDFEQSSEYKDALEQYKADWLHQCSKCGDYHDSLADFYNPTDENPLICFSCVRSDVREDK